MTTASNSWRAIAVVLFTAVVLAGCAANRAAPTGVTPEQIQGARTPADHLALASRYEREAAGARVKASDHTTMAKTYGPYPAGRSGFNIQAHCRELVKTFDTQASEYDQLAAYHRLLAGGGAP